MVEFRLLGWKAVRLLLLSCLVGIFFMGLPACSGEDGKQGDKGGVDSQQPGAEVKPKPLEPAVESILAHEAARLFEEEPGLLVVDVRSVEEREAAYITGSLSIPLEELISGTQPPPKNRPLLLVGAMGGRSYAATLHLQQVGYIRLFNLRGGMIAWQKAGLPVEKKIADSRLQ